MFYNLNNKWGYLVGVVSFITNIVWALNSGDIKEDATIKDGGIIKEISIQSDSTTDISQKEILSHTPELLPYKPQIKVIPDKSKLHTGEVLTLTIEIKRKRDVKVYLSPEREAPFGKFEKRKESESTVVDIDKEWVKQTFKLELQAFEPGEYEIPALEFVFVTPEGKVGKLETDPLKVRVVGYTANEPQPELKDVTPPLPVYETNWVLIYVLIGIGTAIVVISLFFIIRWVWRKFHPPKPPPPPPPRPPYDLAMEKLMQLKVTNWLEKGYTKEFFFVISEVLREYLGKIYEFEGVESTTKEIVTKLKVWEKEKKKKPLYRIVEGSDRKIELNINVHLPSGILPRIEDILEFSDLVKFAEVKPSNEEAIRYLEESIKIVDELREMAWGVYQSWIPIKESLSVESIREKEKKIKER